MRAAPFKEEQSPDPEVLQARIAELQSQVMFMCLCYAQLHYTHHDLLRRLHGAKSQKLAAVLKNAAQSGVSVLSAEAPAGAAGNTMADTEQPAATVAKKPRKHGGGGRRTPPEHLPIVREVIDLPEEQKVGLKWIRNETTTQLEYRPSLFYLRQIVRPVYASPTRAHAPKVVPLPPQVIPQSGVGVTFIAHVITAKYLDAIPYFRQESIDARGGAFVCRQARYRYATAGANLLMTIREGLKHLIIAGGYLQIDETFAALIDPDRGGRTRTAFLWGYHSPKLKACVLEFSLSRSGVILNEFFEDDPDFCGTIQSDGAPMYRRFARKHPQIQHVNCMQHLRKHLIEALQADEANTLPLLDDIAALYAIEEQAREFTDAKRGLWRHGKAKPILKRLQKHFLQLRKDPSLFGHLRKAVIYATNRWPELARYARLENGNLAIDNNKLESLFRSPKVGLRSFLFIGHPAAGWVSAVLYSIMATCKLLQVNPEEYLIWALPQLAARKTPRAYDGLLPHDFARLQAEHAANVPDFPEAWLKRARPPPIDNN
jgi:transposase